MHDCMHFGGYPVAVGVCRSRRLFAALAGAFIAMTGPVDAVAQNSGATPIRPVPVPDLSKAPSSAPLQGVMRLNPSKFGARAASAPGVSVQSIQDACLAIDKNRYAQALRDIQNKENLCATATYSIDDQRTAGCRSADTEDQCQTKLYNYCMDRGGDRVAFRNVANQEISAARRARDMLDAYIRYIENTRPLHSGEVEPRPALPQLPRLETVPIK